MTPKQKQVLREAILTYGAHAQIDMLHEEIGELMQKINKVKRHSLIGWFNISKGKTHLENLDYAGLCGEIADVKIMLAQLEIMVDKETVELCFDRKIQRLHERIEKYKEQNLNP